MLLRSLKFASPLECAVVKNASLGPMESALARSLELKSSEINTCKKVGGALCVRQLDETRSCVFARRYPTQRRLTCGT